VESLVVEWEEKLRMNQIPVEEEEDEKDDFDYDFPST
jgi:hypothetical protein